MGDKPQNKTFLQSFMEHFPLELRAASENALMAPSQITINKQEQVLRGRVESLKQLKNHVFSSGSNTNVNTPKLNNKPNTKPQANNTPKTNTRSSTGSSSASSVKSPTNMFGGKRRSRKTRRKRRN